MDFNFDTGAIYGGLQTLDVTALPPLGGQAGVLTVAGTGAIKLTSGTTVERPSTAAAGMFRYNSDSTALEFYNNTTWVQLSVGGGTVTSVAASGSNGITVSGSPITTSGTIALSLGDITPTSVAATGTVTGSNLSGTNTGDQTITLTGDVTGSGTGSFATTLATVNSSPQTDAFVKVTVNDKGLVTATSAVTTSDITTLVDGTYVNISGDTMASAANLTFTGGGEVLGLPATPTTGGSAASKSYVDSVAAGLSWKQSVKAASTANIDLTTGGLLVIDGYQTVAGDRILVKNQTTLAQNGIYVAGTGAWVRSTDMDAVTPINEINGAAVFAEEGTANHDTAWVQIDNVQTVGTDPIEFTQFAGVGTYTAGAGLTLSGNTFSLTSPVATSLGGTGLTTTATDGQLLIGNGTGYTLANITGGTGLSVTNGAGTISLANTGVTSIAGTSGQVAVDASTGAVTVSIPTVFVAPGSIEATTSLTVSGLTSNAAMYVGAAGLVSSVALTDGQLLIGSTGLAPVAATLTGGQGITVTNGAGAITIDVDNTQVVTSFSTGTTGLTPSAATTGDIILGGTLAVANGGTGLTALGTANQVFGVDAAGTSAEYKTLAAGTGMSVVHGANVVTFNNTGVTSVALTAPSIFTVSGSPVTTTGTLDFALNTQVANTVFAGPSTGSAAAPTFRTLAYADLPIKLYDENVVSSALPTAIAADSVAIGNGASATTYGQKAFANGSFVTAGDAQHGVYVARNITTDATVTELFLDGASTQLVMPDNSVFTFDILVAARRTDATGGGAAYRFVGAARKDATAGSVTFIGTPSKTIVGETDAPWDAAVSVDTTTGAFRVRVTGEAAKEIRWVATIQTTEVTN